MSGKGQTQDDRQADCEAGAGWVSVDLTKGRFLQQDLAQGRELIEELFSFL